MQVMEPVAAVGTLNYEESFFESVSSLLVFFQENKTFDLDRFQGKVKKGALLWR